MAKRRIKTAVLGFLGTLIAIKAVQVFGITFVADFMTRSVAPFVGIFVEVTPKEVAFLLFSASITAVVAHYIYTDKVKFKFLKKL